MINNPDLLTVLLAYRRHTLILEWNVIEIRLISIPRDLFSFFVSFWLTRQLGNLKTHNGYHWINYVFGIKIDTRAFCRRRSLCFFFRITSSCWRFRFRCCFSFGGRGVGSRLKLDLLYPSLKFLGTNIAHRWVECIQVPEAFIDQIEDIRVKV